MADEDKWKPPMEEDEEDEEEVDEAVSDALSIIT